MYVYLVPLNMVSTKKKKKENRGGELSVCLWVKVLHPYG